MTLTVGLSDPLDFDSDVPVHEQIAQRVKFAIGRGAFAPGAQLPSVRGLARDLLVNPNTVVRVYRRLETEGLIYTRRGKGVFVQDAAADRCQGDGEALVRRALRDAVELAGRAGIRGKELERLWKAAKEEA